MQWLAEKDIEVKLKTVESYLQQLLSGSKTAEVPELPGRSITYLPISHLQGRLGLSTLKGQVKLLHDLANIELQAMELGVRSLCEFPDADPNLRQQLATIVLEEAKHLKMCLQAIESLGGYWGQWPVHLGLWHATHQKDTLLERLFIVHRYLEGSGLDAGDTLLRRLSGVNNPIINQTVKTIVEEEVGHVRFGNFWFRHYAKEQKVDEKKFFHRMCATLMHRHPRKDKISVDFRQRAGFADYEIQALQQLRTTY